MLSFGQCVQSCELFGSEPDGNDLHRLGPAPWPTASATLQLLDVVARFGLLRQLLNLRVSNHKKIV